MLFKHCHSLAPMACSKMLLWKVYHCFLNLMMPEEMMESTTCTFLSPSLPLSRSLSFSLPPSIPACLSVCLSLSLSLFLFPSLYIPACLSVCLSISLSLSLSLSLGNKPTETYSKSKKTHASVTLAGACEVINSRGFRGADHQPAILCYLQCGQQYQNYL